MSSHFTNEPNTPLDPLLERALREIHDEPVDPAMIAGAAERVWARIATEAATHPAASFPMDGIHSCADYQALLPAFRSGSLTPARRILVADHLHECVTCRKISEGAGRVIAFPGGTPLTPLTKPSVRPSLLAAVWQRGPVVRYALAAAMAVAVGLGSWGVYSSNLLATGSRATAEAVDGRVYAVTASSVRLVNVGDTLEPGVEIRSARDSSALIRLKDGSLVEMRERSGFRVTEAPRNVTVSLAHGSVIVEAAKRRSGNLFVNTADCRVAVTGTVFSVNAGLKGSRVSVVEGEVHVAHEGTETILHAGQQKTTEASVGKVGVREEISWSRNFEKHLGLLSEFARLEQDLKQMPMPAMRFDSRLLDRLPADTAIVASVPNVAQQLSDSYQVFQKRVSESPVLKDWWESAAHGSRNSAKIQRIMDEIRQVGGYLGDEIVIAASVNPKGGPGLPVAMAQLKRGGFREFVENEVQRAGGKRDDILFLDDATRAVAPARNHTLMLSVKNDMVTLGFDLASMNQAEVSETGGGFAGTPLHSRVSEAYRRGVNVLFAADLGSLTAAALANSRKPATFVAAGMANLKYLVFESREQPAPDTRAEITFTSERKGVWSWLGKPAPLTSLEFVGPEAMAAMSFTIKQPGAVLNELFAMAGAEHANFEEELAKVEAELGVNIRTDIGGSLGAEATIAFDGPMLPTPSWKVVAEVYDPSRLQFAIGKAIEAFNRKAAEHSRPPLTLTQEAANGRVYYKLSAPEGVVSPDAYWVYSDGYMIIAPSTVLLERALQYRASGSNLSRSTAFRSLLPRDRFTNVSALLYQNFGPTLGSAAQALGGVNALGGAQKQALDSLTQTMKSGLVAVYGDEDRITLASTSELFIVSPAALARAQSLAAMMQLLTQRTSGSPLQELKKNLAVH